MTKYRSKKMHSRMNPGFDSMTRITGIATADIKPHTTAWVGRKPLATTGAL